MMNNRYAGGGIVKTGLKGALRQLAESMAPKMAEESKLGDLVPYESKAPATMSPSGGPLSDPQVAESIAQLSGGVDPSRRGFLKQMGSLAVNSALPASGPLGIAAKQLMMNNPETALAGVVKEALPDGAMSGVEGSISASPELTIPFTKMLRKLKTLDEGSLSDKYNIYPDYRLFDSPDAETPAALEKEILYYLNSNLEDHPKEVKKFLEDNGLRLTEEGYSYNPDKLENIKHLIKVIKKHQVGREVPSRRIHPSIYESFGITPQDIDEGWNMPYDLEWGDDYTDDVVNALQGVLGTIKSFGPRTPSPKKPSPK